MLRTLTPIATRPPGRPIRVLLADDHALFRAGLRSLLGAVPDLEVAGEAADGHAALRLVEELRPDVILLDISMPGLNGLEVGERVARGHPYTRVIVLSMHRGQEYVSRALRTGAVGYVAKEADRAELELAIRSVARGEVYVSPCASQAVSSALARGVAVPLREPLERLSPRQREVLQLIAEGHGTSDVADRLHLSVKTVETHRAHIQKRLGIRDLPGLVRFAIRAGLVSAEG